MAIVQNINIDGKEVPFKASAALPRIYRLRFGRDIFADLDAMASAIKKNDEDHSTLDGVTLEMFENIAYLMAKYADKDVPDSIDEWLDGFNTFSIYQVLPQLMELWGLNIETQIDSKKNFDRLIAR